MFFGTFRSFLPHYLLRLYHFFGYTLSLEVIKMKKKIVLTVILSLLVCMSMITVSAKDAAISWYCVRNKDHRQPTADPALRVVEKYNGYYVDHAHGDDNEEKVIYLTFDAGYENGNVAKILDILHEEQVTGAFFILDHLILDNTALVCRMAEEGHVVANHTAKHRDITKMESKECLQKELSALEELYRTKTGREMSKYFRPPEGRFSEQSMQWLSELGYQTVFWSVAYADWDNQRQPDPTVAKAKIMDHLHNGAVILLHPTSATNVKILGDLIRECRSLGYRFGSLEELTANASHA